MPKTSETPQLAAAVDCLELAFNDTDNSLARFDTAITALRLYKEPNDALVGSLRQAAENLKTAAANTETAIRNLTGEGPPAGRSGYVMVNLGSATGAPIYSLHRFPLIERARVERDLALNYAGHEFLHWTDPRVRAALRAERRGFTIPPLPGRQH